MYPPPAPKPASTTGPKILTFSGIFLLLVGLAGIGIAIAMIIGNLPMNVITPQGQPGSDALAGITASEELQFDSPGGTSYDLWEVQASLGGQSIFGTASVTVTGPDGSAVSVRNAEVNGNMTLGTYRAETFASFQAAESGTYIITLTPRPGSEPLSSNVEFGEATPVDAVLSQGSEFPSFLTGIFTSIGAMFLGIFALLLGFGLVIGGVIWWVSVNGRRRRAAGGF